MSLRRSEIPDTVAKLRDCSVVAVHHVEGIPQRVTFKLEPFQFDITTASMSGQPSDEDLDRAWLWAGFHRDAAIDLPFVNDFNARAHVASAAIVEKGVQLHDHFILAGLPKEAAELVICHHILAFRREVREFTLMRNERARSASAN